MKICNYKGQLIYFDLELWEFINTVTGFTVNTTESGHKYIVCTRGIYRKIILARILMNCPEDKFIDHHNGNPLDNRLCNLRVVTIQQNAFNKTAGKNKKSGLPKGVYKHKDKYQAQIRWHGALYNLGTFPTVEQAEAAYNIKAKEWQGEYAVANRSLT